MPLTLVGIVYYADDPAKKVFRIVYPVKDDSELDQPDPQHGEWTKFGADPSRVAVMEKIPADDPRATLDFFSSLDDR